MDSEKVARAALRRRAVAAVLAFVLVVTGCGDDDAKNAKNDAKNTPPSNGPATEDLPNAAARNYDDPGTSLQSRIQRRWAAIIQGELELAYTFLSAEYRATQTEEQYVSQMRARPVTWVSSEWVDQKCDTPVSCKAEVKVLVRFEIPGRDAVESLNVVTEHWMDSNGTWYFTPPQDR